jgi:Asp-tRNA(Asn)/Glu-tRNA(Gln) amidotransferase C subunit
MLQRLIVNLYSTDGSSVEENRKEIITDSFEDILEYIEELESEKIRIVSFETDFHITNNEDCVYLRKVALAIERFFENNE